MRLGQDAYLNKSDNNFKSIFIQENFIKPLVENSSSLEAIFYVSFVIIIIIIINMFILKVIFKLFESNRRTFL